MSDATVFATSYFTAIRNLIGDLETLRELNDRLAQDSTLFTRYFQSDGARKDIDAAAITAAENAIAQLIFSFDSGSPPQKAALFNLL